MRGWTFIKTPKRKAEITDKKIGVIFNGEDNAYPSRMENFVNNSITSKMCANMYARFLMGHGFEDASLNQVVIGEDYRTGKKITAYRLLQAKARELSRHSGFFIKCGYNANLKIDTLELITSKYCRFGKRDDKNYSGKILVYDNWGGDDGKLDKSKIIVFNTYSDNEAIIKSQIAGKRNANDNDIIKSIQNWKGQIYTQFIDDEYTYPLSFIDPVQHDSDTEFQISLFKNGELRRGFFAKYIIAYDQFEDDADADQFISDLKSLEGASEGGSVLVIEGAERKSDTNEFIMPFAIEKIEQNINDKLFSEYEKSTANNIRKAYNNIPPVLVDYQEGKLGNTSGESIREAIEFYNDQTRSHRAILEDSFTELMSNWHVAELNNKNWAIKELGSIDAPEY